METIIVESEKLKEHPMEKILDIEPCTTSIPMIQRQSTNIAETTTAEYDDKDNEIEEQFQEVYDAAMDGFDVQMGTTEGVEGKYQARNGEVAIQFLSTALQAAKEKSNVKQHKDKLGVAKGKLAGAGTTNNNLIVADRNDILKAINNKT